MNEIFIYDHAILNISMIELSCREFNNMKLRNNKLTIFPTLSLFIDKILYNWLHIVQKC